MCVVLPVLSLKYILCLFLVCVGCGPHLELKGEEVQKQASHCNDKKTASKRVQELSSELFFSVFVKVHPRHCIMFPLEQGC